MKYNKTSIKTNLVGDVKIPPLCETVDFPVTNIVNSSREQVPIDKKMLLTVNEAAEYSNIGINKINSMLRRPDCPFVLYVGAKKLVKRKIFEEYIFSITEV